jgi:hypothetical protein
MTQRQHGVDCAAANTGTTSEKHKMKALTAITMLTLSACGNSGSNPSASTAPAAASDLPAQGAFVDRIWVSTERGRPLGSMIIFLPNRMLLMDSCFETYRISEWGVAGDHIRWLEDTVPIEAEVSMPGKDELTLRVIGREETQTYMAASAPYVCPDMPK